MKSAVRHCLAIATVLLAAACAHAADAIFITNGGPDTLSKEEVKNILLGNKTKWNTGGLIKLAVLTEGPVHEQVIQGFTARSTDQFDKYWKKQVFTGKGVAPDAFKTDADLMAFVAKTPGSFGYIAGGTTPSGVKVVGVQ